MNIKQTSEKLSKSGKIKKTGRVLAVGAAFYSDFRAADVFYGAAAGLLMIIMLMYSLAALWFQYYSRNVTGHISSLRAAALASGLYVSFLMYHLMSLLPADILWAVVRAASGKEIPHRAFSAAALGSGIGVTEYGRRHAKHLKMVSYAVHSEKWEQDGEYRIVLLSDLHIGAITGVSYMRKAVQMTNELHPDLVVITGDIFNRTAANENPDPSAVFDELSKIKAKDGVYAVRGNHDPEEESSAWQQFLREANVHGLDNKYVHIGDKILAGRTGLAGDNGRKPLKAILKNTDRDKYTIVLDHDPKGIPEARDEGADLVLCGHTHGGQYFPCTLLTRYWYGRDYCHGIHTEGGCVSIVSSGTGFFQIPVRVGTDSEVILIRLQ